MEQIRQAIFPSRGHNRKVIVTVSGLNGMGSRGSVNPASTSLPLKSSLCGSFSPATRKKCVASARAHLVQEREIDLQVCVFFSLANSDCNLVADTQCRCQSCGKAAGFSELLVARNGLQCRVMGTCVFVFSFGLRLQFRSTGCSLVSNKERKEPYCENRFLVDVLRDFMSSLLQEIVCDDVL